MRTLFKKSLCILLLLSMLLSMMPVGAMAIGTEGSAGGEGSSSSISGEIAELLAQVEGLPEPVFTHNEKVAMYADGDNHHELSYNYGGTYFIANWWNGYHNVLNPVARGDVLDSEPVTTDQDLLLGVNMDMALELIPVEVSDGSYNSVYFWIKTRTGKYIHFTNNHIALMDYDYSRRSSFYMYDGGLMWYNWMSDGYRYAVTMDSAATYYYQVSDDEAILDCCKLEAYKLVTLETLKDLYRQIKDGAQYLDGGDYTESVYEEFLSVLEESLSLYNASNVYQTGKNLASIAALSQTLETQGDKLYEAMGTLFESIPVEEQAARILDKVEALNPYGTYNKLVDLSGIKSDLKGDHMAMNVMWNKGFLAIVYRGEYMLMDGVSSSAGTVIGTKARVRNNTVDTINENHSNQLIQFHLRTTNSNHDTSYDFKWVANGKYLQRDASYTANPAQAVSGSDENYHWAHSTDEERVLITDGGRCIYYNGTNAADDSGTPAQSFGWANDYRNRGDQFTANLYFFRQWSTQDLYNGLQEVKYLLENPGNYTEANYQIFLNRYRNCIDLYELWNDIYPRENLIPQDIFITYMEEAVYELRSCKRLLNDSMDYLDIPMEVLDFRADGLLFEAYNAFASAYAMSFSTEDVKDATRETVAKFPGQVIYGDNYSYPADPNSDYQQRIIGLVKDELYQGKIVYKEETIIFIAHALHQARVNNAQPNESNPFKHLALGYNFQEDHNGVFARKHQELTANDLGSWSATLSKIGGVNGGPMTWDQVTTYFDFAYYILNYLWQAVPTESGNVLETVSTGKFSSKDMYYNLQVPELHTMRMYKDASGYYTFNSWNGHGRTGGYLYNNGLDRIAALPNLNLVSNLGFAHEDYFGSRSTGHNELDGSSYKSNSNYGYALHVHGCFQYYEDSNLNFTFIGDDDVYFFINGKLVCDIGGVHGAPSATVYLNEQDNLDLENGDICTFDMFFADRHVTGINLRLSTNIQIMNEDVLTSKEQYAEELNGASLVDASGMGRKLTDNALVNVGARTAYSFSLLNKSAVPVNKLSFVDDSMGVSLSKDKLVLGDLSKNNITTNLSDLIVIYRSVEDGIVNEESLKDITTSDLTDIINESNEMTVDVTQPVYGTFPEGSYRISDLTQTNLMALLELGLPRNCQITIYGFKRITQIGDRPYTNTVNSLCYNAYVGGGAIRGTASRNIQVPDMENIALPTADTEQVVIDYGKPVAIPLEELGAHIYDNRNASAGAFVGLTQQGNYSGELLRAMPTDLTKVGIETEIGSFTVGEKEIVYEHRQFLSEIERVYAVYALTGCYGMDTNGTSVEYKYILVEIEVIPATIMYYEAEDLLKQESDEQGEIEAYNTTDGGQGDKTPWEITGVGQEENQEFRRVSDTVYSMEIQDQAIPSDAFFADFNGTGYGERYSVNPLYGGLDFDMSGSWCTFEGGMTAPAVDTDKGTLSTSVIKEDGGNIYVQTGTAQMDTPYPLSYKPSKDTYLQIRYKTEGLKKMPNTDLFFDLRYYTVEETGYTDTVMEKVAISYILTETEEPEDGLYQTLCVKIPEDSTFYDEELIRCFRVGFYGLENKTSGVPGSLVFDYIYIGPETGLKKDFYQQSLFFGFDNTSGDIMRYQTSLYGNLIFDDINNWVIGSGENAKIENGALSFTDNNTSTTINYAHSGKWGTLSPLHYTPHRNDYGQIRIRVDNGTSTKTDKTFFIGLEAYDYSSGSAVLIAQMGKYVPIEEFSDGEYHTVTFPMNEEEYVKQTDISCIRFAVNSIQGATYTIDYIFVGPKDSLDDMNQRFDQQRELEGIYFTFDDTSADRIRYEGATYAGVNFDLGSNWYKGNNTSEPQTSGGFLTYHDTLDTVDSTTPSNNNVWAQIGPEIAYRPRAKDICRIRLRIDKATSTYTNGNFSFRIDYNARKGNAEVFKSSSTVTYQLEKYVNKGFFTLEFPMETVNNAYATMDHIYSFNLVLCSTNGAYVTVDFVFIGQADEIAAMEAPIDYIFFGFDNTDGDQLRYSSSGYNGINYDGSDGNKKATAWWANSSDPVTVDGGALSFTDTDFSSGQNYNYIRPNQDGLKYVVGEQDYCRIRFKLTGSAESTNTDKTVSLALMFRTEDHTDASVSAGYTTFPLNEVLNKGYVTMTFPLGNNNPNYAPGEVVTCVFPQFGGVQKATFTIDYLYVGPLEGALPMEESIYFGFDDMETDRNRYHSDTYGYLNFDGVDQNGKNYWATQYTGKQGTQFTSADYILSTSKGLLTVNVSGDKLFTESGQSYYRTSLKPTSTFGTYPSEDVANQVYFPLHYRPDQADVIQIRFKLVNCTAATGYAHEPYLSVIYHGEKNGSRYTAEDIDEFAGFACYVDVSEREYQTVTIPVTEDLRDMDFVDDIELRFWHLIGGTDSSVVIDYIYMGPGKVAPDPVYGYDPSYEDDSFLSNNSSMVVEGQGVKLPDRFDENGNLTWTYTGSYTEASFSFTGTGFDIISRTGKEQATIRVEVLNRKTGEIVKSLTVNNKGELELYQIPVVSVQGLSYGEYTVTLWVNKALNSIYDFLSRGGEFYLDGIRIYDTICVDGEELTDVQQATLNAYETDKEAYNYIKEVRNILLSADEFYALTDTVQGAVFVDVNSPTVNPYPTEEQGTEGEPEVTQPTTPPYISTEGYNAMTVLTYNKLGPKNEVYLAPDQAIAFMLQIDTARKPMSIDIGAKTIQGDTVTLAAGFVSTKKADAPETLTAVLKEISTSTAQYYALDETKVSAGDTVYLVLYNATEKTAGLGETDKVLSITDIKIAYDGHPDTPLPEDQITDKEVFPTAPSESTGGDDSTDTGSDSTGGNGSGSGSGSNSGGASGAGIKMLIGGDAVSAVRSFMVAIHETPVAEPEEPETPALQGDMRIYHSLNLASDISVNFLVSKADLAGFDLSSVYMECRKETFDGNKRAGYTTMRLEPVEKGEYYYFTLTGLTAVNMNDRIYTTLYGVKDGQEYYSATDDYSITDYAYAQLGKAGIPESLKILCADLLRYGAKAQIFKSYRTDRLADADLTEEQRAYLSDINTVTFGNTNKMMEDLDNAPIAWVGKALDLDSKVCLKFVFDPSGYKGPASDLSLVVSYKDLYGQSMVVTLRDPQVYDANRGWYSFTLDTLLAAELRTVISAQMYSGDAPVSATLQYSPDTYGNGKTDTLGDLCKALFAYSDSAKAYFTS